MVNSLTSHQS